MKFFFIGFEFCSRINRIAIGWIEPTSPNFLIDRAWLSRAMSRAAENGSFSSLYSSILYKEGTRMITESEKERNKQSKLSIVKHKSVEWRMNGEYHGLLNA